MVVVAAAAIFGKINVPWREGKTIREFDSELNEEENQT